MPASSFQPFQPDALDANRRGELSDSQRRGFGSLSSRNRRGALSSAAFLVAGSLLILFFASPSASPTMRMLIPLIGLTIAAVLVARSVTGTDALSRDVREGRVESVEGAIGKRHTAVSGASSATTYFLDVGDRTFRVAGGTQKAAPDAGIVRLYFLPRSRKVVNFERLENAPPPTDISPKGVASLLGAALFSPTRHEANEARAQLDGLGEAMATAFTPSPATGPPGGRDPRPLAQAILGRWTNGFLSLTFAPDGDVTSHMIHGELRGRWSVDGAGRLRADIAGHEQAADAWVAGNRLTIAAEGEGLTFARESEV